MRLSDSRPERYFSAGGPTHRTQIRSSFPPKLALDRQEGAGRSTAGRGTTKKLAGAAKNIGALAEHVAEQVRVAGKALGGHEARRSPDRGPPREPDEAVPSGKVRLIGASRLSQNNLISRLSKRVSAIESTIDQTRQPGMKRT